VVGALQAVGRGEYETRLPVLPGKEGASISRAFNGMAQAIGESAGARREAAEAAARLAQNRELTQLIQSRIEDERGALARELHDEMGQSLTAMKSLAASIAQRDGLQEDTRAEGGVSESRTTESKASGSSRNESDTSRQAARAIVQIADHLYQVVHGIIPRLRPLALDNFGLADALEDLLGDWRLREPRIEFSMQVDELPEALPDAIATAVYRIVQEALTNSIRHAGASRIRVDLEREGVTLVVRISDNGRGLTADPQVPGHYGVIGMRERAMALGGTLELASADGGGLNVVARIPT
jgi:two-component system sensor histidine kinase UhpB